MKSELQRKLWINNAQKLRPRVLEILRLAMGEDISIHFLDDAESDTFGSAFWSRARLEHARTVDSAATGLGMLNPASIDSTKKLIYFHSKTAECGAITLGSLVILSSDVAIRLQQDLGPDFLLMSTDAQFGVCYEESEYARTMRIWGAHKRVDPDRNE